MMFGQITITTKMSHAVNTAQCYANSFYHVSDQKVFSMFVLLLIDPVRSNRVCINRAVASWMKLAFSPLQQK